MLAIFRAHGTWPAKNDLFKSEQKVGTISIAHSFNTRGERWSGPGNLCGLRFLRRQETSFGLQRVVYNLESTTLLYAGKFP